MGVIEKHGQHLPLGTDVYTGREVSLRAAGKEYCLVFPYHPMGQNFVAMPQPGAIAHTTNLMYKWLDETCREISRNGIKKIILLNAHGGNSNFLNFFLQKQMESPRDYVVYFTGASPDAETQRKIREMSKATNDGHAGELETSQMLAVRPDLVNMDRALAENFENQNLLPLGGLTGLRWYGQYPNHFAGNPITGNAPLGELDIEGSAVSLAKIIKEVKGDKTTLQLQEEFFKKSQTPLETKAR
jgi:creatinine amidohydrolase